MEITEKEALFARNLKDSPSGTAILDHMTNTIKNEVGLIYLHHQIQSLPKFYFIFKSKYSILINCAADHFKT